MSADRIAELRVMVAEATTGPWVEFFKDDGGKWTGWPISIEAVSFTDKVVVRPGGQWPYDWDAGVSQNEAIANARLIAQAPTLATDLAAALAEVERLRDFVDEFSSAKIHALRFPGVIRSPEDEPDPVVDAEEVWAWQEDARAVLKAKP